MEKFMLYVNNRIMYWTFYDMKQAVKLMSELKQIEEVDDIELVRLLPEYRVVTSWNRKLVEELRKEGLGL